MSVAHSLHCGFISVFYQAAFSGSLQLFSPQSTPDVGAISLGLLLLCTWSPVPSRSPPSSTFLFSKSATLSYLRLHFSHPACLSFITLLLLLYRLVQASSFLWGASLLFSERDSIPVSPSSSLDLSVALNNCCPSFHRSPRHRPLWSRLIHALLFFFFCPPDVHHKTLEGFSKIGGQ